MEYPPLVAGQTVRFAVHLTRLADFSALNAGRPRIEMTPEAGGAAVTLPGSEPLRPGAFRVEGALPPAGRYRWALLVDAPGLADRHDLGVTTVFADAAAGGGRRGEAARGRSRGHRLPERAAVDESVRDGAGARGRGARRRCACRRPFEPVTGGEAIVAAPAAGRFAADTLISIGATVRAGQVLGRSSRG